ncbi:invasion associated locus B family protein [Altericroceibacterium endophyticum]|uniref:Invasion associated locus B family protein n=1 Tax=Altericroceibacterium endophyticum TaxID=1808508 RepID=A0A6I4T470_9SPHN|nr:invasion associated locus B family protein [Altericroceibacterium endophyticum]MXO64355.1 hypothetical protein [Altericroceibacterium endophyticum]
MRLTSKAMLVAGATLTALMANAPASATNAESLGIYENWGAFRSSEPLNCYAIAKASNSNASKQAYVSISVWPGRNIRDQIHFRLSRKRSASSSIRLRIDGTRFALIGRSRDAWSKNAATDRNIAKAMRSASRMTISATDTSGKRFHDRYDLSGIASAMDAAHLGCISAD